MILMMIENQIYNQDCLEGMKNLPDGSVDLIYLDPPFFTQRKHIQKTRDNSKEYSFEDVWTDMDEYVRYLEIRVTECAKLLKKTGSIFFHCDKKASHHLRLMLDRVFGENNFRSEIIWTYKRWSNAKNGLLNSHQNIFFYSKSDDFKFNKIFTDYSPTTNIDQILQDRTRNENNKSVYKRDKLGLIVLGKEKMGVPLSDVWDIPFLNPKAEERVGYPTQKPIILLERIISLVTDEGDLVLDPFCGSGTTLIAASILGRKYIGIDASPDAAGLSLKRLKLPIKTNSRVFELGLESYRTTDEKIKTILLQIDAIIVRRNKGIDGILKKYYKNTPVPIYIQRQNQLLEDAFLLLKTAGNKKGAIKKILIRTNTSSNKIKNEVITDDIIIVDDMRCEIESLLSTL